jgi:hypothetical protein
MLFQIEFFRGPTDKPGDDIVRRNSGQFASEKDVEIYGRMKRPAEATGFRILKNGVVRKTIFIQSEAPDAESP